jgi:hypothetical protein
MVAIDRVRPERHLHGLIEPLLHRCHIVFAGIGECSRNDTLYCRLLWMR